MTRTPWFPLESPPVREGWYEVKLPNFPPCMRLEWDGKWRLHHVQEFFRIDDFLRDFRWRGVARSRQSAGVCPK
jgi:hypothetical protein